MNLHVTHHALERYQERVRPCSFAAAERALRSYTITLAAAFGAPVVRLAGGQRVVLRGRAVVTVLPAGDFVELVYQSIRKHEAAR